MKVLKMMPIGAALFALSLGLSSIAPSLASARDEDQGTSDERGLIRVAQDDRDSDRDDNSGYLGVQVQRLTAALRRAKGIPDALEGTLVSNVEDESPADDGGIKPGDVIVEVNHESTASPSDLVQTVRGLRVGSRVSVQIWRDGVTRTVSLKVGSRPSGSDLPQPPPNWGGPGPGDSSDMPDNGRMQILRRNRDDLARQVRELQEQIARLEREIRDLRSDFQKQHDRKSRDRDENRNEDRDRDSNEDD
jgi:membrane-associated protease RseP (regulator of RpoE activity)